MRSPNRKPEVPKSNPASEKSTLNLSLVVFGDEERGTRVRRGWLPKLSKASAGKTAFLFIIKVVGEAGLEPAKA